MHIFLSLVFSALAADSPWIERHLNCYRGINRELVLPSLRVTTFLQGDRAFASKWGELMAVPGTKGERAGLFLLGNGRTYFVEMPQPNDREPTTQDFYRRLYASGSEYAFVARFPDGQPDVRFYVTLGVPFVRVEISAAADYEPGFARKVAEPAEPPDLEGESAEVLLRILAHNAVRPGDLDRHGREAVRRCKRTLDLSDPFDRRIEAQTRRLLP